MSGCICVCVCYGVLHVLMAICMFVCVWYAIVSLNSILLLLIRLMLSLQKSMTYNPSGVLKICAVDCGLKYNQLRCFIQRGVKVELVPWDHQINLEQYDGLFLSNGPGDPSMCITTVENIRKAMKVGKPIFGICLGHQLLAIAAGCSTYKMK